jgi:hypothetical protein
MIVGGESFRRMPGEGEAPAEPLRNSPTDHRLPRRKAKPANEFEFF